MEKPKNCPKCGQKFKPSNKFCISCGSTVTVGDISMGENKSFSTLVKIIIIVVVIIAIAFGFLVAKDVINNLIEKQRIADEDRNANNVPSTTNPVYLSNPNGFIIDSEKQISNDPDDNKSVWVEKVVDNNTIIVSYLIIKGNENFITFRTIEITGIYDIGSNDCRSRLATDFLKRFIEHKYVYLATPEDYKSVDKLKPRLLRYVSILSSDVDPLVLDFSKLKSDEQISVEKNLVYAGYAVANYHIGDFNYALGLQNNEQEVARAAKRGFWGTCK
ncbi:MAG: zinc ribbon domain-containing protein [Candidatus Buchananbacteria bacterium]|nr:zinc ribbon domain-containing protein [Candidatus Buchananbacteria bacterium]